MREALSALAERGLVEIRMRSGVYLCDTPLGSIEEATSPALNEALDALATVGPALVERVSTVCGEADHERAERITARLGRALVDRNPYEAWQGLMAFYGGLASSTNNALLQRTIEDIALAGGRQCADQSHREPLAEALQAFFAAHVEMLQAMRQRDAAGAAKLAAGSIMAFRLMLDTGLDMAGDAEHATGHDMQQNKGNAA